MPNAAFELRLFCLLAVPLQSPVDTGDYANMPPPDDLDALRSIKYTFPAQFLTYKTIRTS